jgi:hypothetical protein
MNPNTLPRSKHVGLEVHSRAHEGIGYAYHTQHGLGLLDQAYAFKGVRLELPRLSPLFLGPLQYTRLGLTVH